ncbi:hypothetical protein NPIL_316861 [Nephila pilipes]|uniref:Uncharacterized protein n=1 Tax=Nephila pilipes TaxID=299642 RepID=A0A8X6NJX4_NEPPI|nr:hypothetical protein NPIL_316861 [Nephila pilipes]
MHIHSDRAVCHQMIVMADIWRIVMAVAKHSGCNGSRLKFIRINANNYAYLSDMMHIDSDRAVCRQMMVMADISTPVLVKSVHQLKLLYSRVVYGTAG